MEKSGKLQLIYTFIYKRYKTLTFIINFFQINVLNMHGILKINPSYSLKFYSSFIILKNSLGIFFEKFYFVTPI